MTTEAPSFLKVDVLDGVIDENVAVPPVVSIAGPTDGVRGQPRTFTLAATDPQPADQDAGFVYTINWGDGSPVQTILRTPGNGSGVNVDHDFTATGTYTVQVTATDQNNGTSVAATHTISIVAVQMQGNDLVVGGTTGNDLIVINPGGPGRVQVLFGGVRQGRYSPTGRIIVYGQAGDDDIYVAGGVRLSAWLYGGGGSDTLTGGNGNDVLLGGDGDDTLDGGGQGRDLLLGGADADHLTGNAGDDLLIAGPTAFDGNPAALAAVWAEWTSSRSYTARVANLKGTGSGPRANGSTFLNVSGPGVTVSDDAAVDVLSGASGSDWFFANLSGGMALDSINGLGGGEIVEEFIGSPGGFVGFPTGYREPEHGDLSDVGGDPATGGGAPTPLTATVGSNILVANNNADPPGDPLPDRDYFTVTIPEGLLLDRIILLSFATGEPNGTLAFLGVQAGTAFTEPPATVDNPAGPNVANLLGWAHFGDKTDADGNPDPANTPPGTDLLALMGAGEGAIGFTPPLPSGTYTFWLQETGPFSSVYAFDFQVIPA